MTFTKIKVIKLIYSNTYYNHSLIIRTIIISLPPKSDHANAIIAGATISVTSQLASDIILAYYMAVTETQATVSNIH